MPVVVITRWPSIVTAVAPPAHIALTTAWMSCWCTTRRLGFRSLSTACSISSSGASEQGDRDPGALARLQARGIPELFDLVLEASDAFVVDLSGEAVDLLLEVGDPLLQLVVVVGLGVDQGGEVGVAAGAQVGALAVVGADREQRAAQEHHERRADPPDAALALRAALRCLGHAD